MRDDVRLRGGPFAADLLDLVVDHTLELREPEVEELHLATLAQHHVARLDVAMEDALAVRGVEAGGDPDREPERGLPRQRLDQAVEALSGHELVGDVRPLLYLADLVHADHIGVRELRDGARLDEEAPARRRRRIGGGDELQRDEAIQRRVAAEIDMPHAALAEHAIDDELVEGGRGTTPLARAFLGRNCCRGHSSSLYHVNVPPTSTEGST